MQATTKLSYNNYGLCYKTSTLLKVKWNALLAIAFFPSHKVSQTWYVTPKQEFFSPAQIPALFARFSLSFLAPASTVLFALSHLIEFPLTPLPSLQLLNENEV